MLSHFILLFSEWSIKENWKLKRSLNFQREAWWYIGLSWCFTSPYSKLDCPDWARLYFLSSFLLMHLKCSRWDFKILASCHPHGWPRSTFLDFTESGGRHLFFSSLFFFFSVCKIRFIQGREISCQGNRRGLQGRKEPRKWWKLNHLSTISGRWTNESKDVEGKLMQSSQ